MSRRVGLAALALLVAPGLHAMRTEEVWIPMKDGVRLAATLYRPDVEKRGERLPVLLEYLPYRKDDGTFAGDFAPYAYMTDRGYVGARVDVRGTGRSEGRPPDREYSDQEQEDGVEVIAWLARQPWSNGAVGMWGFSWGGFNAHSARGAAAARPEGHPAREAAEDLFQDDIHYIDGLFHVDEYELSMEVAAGDHALAGLPARRGEPGAAGSTNPPWSLLYKRQQRDGPFWRRASLAPARYDAMRGPRPDDRRLV